MSERRRLPDRRLNVTETCRWGGNEFHLGIGFDHEGHIRECFLDGIKVGSDQAALIDDVCVVISRLLQHGENLEALSRTLSREGREPEAASLIGCMLRLMCQVQKEHGAVARNSYMAQLELKGPKGGHDLG